MKTTILISTIIATTVLNIGCNNTNISKSPDKENKIINKDSDIAVNNADSKKEKTVESNKDEKITNITYLLKDTKIEYPKIKKILSDEKLNEVNEIIKKDAMAIIDFYNPENENNTLEVKYEIKLLNLDTLSIAYYGYYDNKDNAYPMKFLCTTNIDLSSQKRLKLETIKNIEEVAEIISNDKYTTKTTDKNLESAQRDAIKQLSKDDLLNMLNNSDFNDTVTYPLSFSYNENNSIVISIPVQHAIGDYTECIIPK